MAKKESESERKPFRHGDVVKYLAKDHWHGRHIIDTISVDENPEHWNYSTDCGAWIPHDCFKLVEESSVSSRAELAQSKIDDREDLSE